MQIKTIYIADDGKRFETEAECREHEGLLAMTTLVATKFDGDKAERIAKFIFANREQIKALLG